MTAMERSGTDQPHLVILGLGYIGTVVARTGVARGWRVTGTHRHLREGEEDGVRRVCFTQVGDALRTATHVLISTPPENGRDPAFALFADIIADACRLRWIGYYSTTGVYGDRAGGTVDETTPPRPTQARGRMRLDAETSWQALAARRRVACDLMRLGGIYGPGRSVLDALRAGTARLIAAPAHLFSRIHRDDAAGATWAAIDTAAGCRVLNLVDSRPSSQSEVTRFGAELLRIAPPQAVSLADSLTGMSETGQSFWKERRVVRSDMTERSLGRCWLYPSYREGLAAILAAEDGVG
ncbi:NAD dependent epimerase/dehydratase [Acidomonas methanolica NBRC 104435]|uniref:NAD dependent epimerase/dehydratase n=2 Tax=Acidomonas methanolica TaxID=437 RepID=A0A023D447_ACIMT|nr:NAD dependent epimerase/dehydratase [Acidomonas methanolica NBRC 104435]GEK98111.1 NAD(P)-dependent oxidoreductase [Acidomonas methanolica NBRC 104435]